MSKSEMVPVGVVPNLAILAYIMCCKIGTSHDLSWNAVGCFF